MFSTTAPEGSLTVVSISRLTGVENVGRPINWFAISVLMPATRFSLSTKNVYDWNTDGV